MDSETTSPHINFTTTFKTFKAVYIYWRKYVFFVLIKDFGRSFWSALLIPPATIDKPSLSWVSRLWQETLPALTRDSSGFDKRLLRHWQETPLASGNLWNCKQVPVYKWICLVSLLYTQRTNDGIIVPKFHLPSWRQGHIMLRKLHLKFRIIFRFDLVDIYLLNLAFWPCIDL